METINIHEAKTHLSKLVEKAASGEAFIIAKAGKPMVKVVPLHAVKGDEPQRLGFLEGTASIPRDIKSPFQKDIEDLFYGS